MLGADDEYVCVVSEWEGGWAVNVTSIWKILRYIFQCVSVQIETMS